MYNFHTQVDINLMDQSDKDDEYEYSDWSLGRSLPKRELTAIGLISAAVFGSLHLPEIAREREIDQANRNIPVTSTISTRP